MEDEAQVALLRAQDESSSSAKGAEQMPDELLKDRGLKNLLRAIRPAVEERLDGIL